MPTINKKLSAVMLGYGYWGRNVAKALQNSSDFELKAIFDLDKSQQDAANTAHHLSTIYKDIQSILEDDSIHSIFIITPPQSHYPLAKLALESGKHIFVEKPLCTNLKEAKELYALAEKKGLSLHCDHIFLYSPAIIWLKENLHLLGNIIYINTRRINLGLFQNSVDVIWDLAIHDLSIIEHLIGLDIKDMEVFTRKYQNHPNDALANINLELTNGVIITINVSWLSPIKVREMIIGGENNTVIYDETKRDKIALYDTGVVIKDTFTPPNLYAKMVEYKLGQTHYPKLQTTMALDNSIAHFAKKITSKDLISHQNDKIHVLKVIDTLQKITALKNNKL